MAKAQNSLKFFEFAPNFAREWDEFVKKTPNGSLHQTSVWKDFQEKISGRGPVLGFGVKRDKKIVAAVFCICMQTGVLGKTWFYSPRGPVFNPEKDSDAGKILMQRVAAELKKNSAAPIFWRFDPYFSTDFFQNFSQKSTQNYQPENTLVLDLTQNESEILAQMKRKGRYNISLAAKKNVVIRSAAGAKITEKDFQSFFRLHQQTTSRNGFRGHDAKYYRLFLRSLPEHATLFLAEIDRTPVAAAILTIFGGKSIYYFGASSSDPSFRNAMAPYLLQWKMMQFAREKGAVSYDFLGIAPVDDAGNFAKNHPFSQITEFKLKFGGTPTAFPPAREKPFRLVWYCVYRMVKKFW